MFSDGGDIFSYAQYHALFVGCVLQDGGIDVQPFCTFIVYV